MIREFSSKAKPSNANARILFIVTLVFAAAFIMISMLIDEYRGVVSLVGTAFIVVAVTLYTRYVGSEYYYEVVCDSEQNWLFVVRQATGKRQSTLCRIALKDIVKIECESAKERQSHKTEAGVVKYSYLPTLYPTKSYRIIASNIYEKAEILIEVSDEFASFLRIYANEAREIASFDAE